MAIVAVLVASFSLREQEPNPCNVKLADDAIRICKELVEEGHKPVVVAQWEVGLAMRLRGHFSDATWPEHTKNGAWPCEEIGRYADGRYLGTKELLKEALPVFRRFGATHFVGVANPFIHQQYLYFLARKKFKLLWRPVGWVGFDKQSAQWWCRSWWQLTFQTVRLALGFSHSHNNRQVQS